METRRRVKVSQTTTGVQFTQLVVFAFEDCIVSELSRLLLLQQLFSLLGASFTPLRSIRHGSSVDAVWFVLLINVYRC